MSGSNDLGSFIRQVRAMINKAEEQIEEIIKVWQLKVATRLVLETPGPGNQWPRTEYIATGRLRAGWNFSVQDPPSGVPLMGLTGEEDGDQYASRTVAKIGIALSSAALGPVAYLWNEVGYGVYVHEGLGGHLHIGPRPWVQWVALEADDLLDDARRQVMGA